MNNEIKSTYEKAEELKEKLGAEYLLEELMKALTDDELKENIEYIAKNHDIEI